MLALIVWLTNQFSSMLTASLIKFMQLILYLCHNVKKSAPWFPSEQMKAKGHQASAFL